ncbi:MAG TPA: CDP-alcohol phosphatidyltransferase family protein [bacterium]
METERSFRIFTIPNILSFFRIALTIPLAIFIWHDNLSGTLIIIIIATASDFLDGKIARHLNQITEVGKMLDPIADKLSIGTILIVLLCKGRVPLWLVLIIVGRDIAILLASVVCFVRKDKLVIASNFLGKVAVNVFGVLVLSFIFDIKILQDIFVPLSVIFVLISSYSYFKNLLLLHKNRTI